MCLYLLHTINYCVIFCFNGIHYTKKLLIIPGITIETSSLLHYYINCGFLLVSFKGHFFNQKWKLHNYAHKDIAFGIFKQQQHLKYTDRCMSVTGQIATFVGIFQMATSLFLAPGLSLKLVKTILA